MALKVIITDIGTVGDGSESSIRSFLQRFLSSSRIIDLNPIFWKIILHLFILPFRPKKLVSRYHILSQQWGANPSTLFAEKIVEKLNKELPSDIEVIYLPVLEKKLDQNFAEEDNIVIFPYYPQYSEATFEFIYDQLDDYPQLKNAIRLREFPLLEEFSSEVALSIDNELHGKEIDALLLSFHSYPQHRIDSGDPYLDQVQKTFDLISQKVDRSNVENIQLSFQSKFGKGEWLGPLIEDRLTQLASQGKKKVAIACPSFLIDCVETLWEIEIDMLERAKKMGIELTYIRCLNDQSRWVKRLSNHFNI